MTTYREQAIVLRKVDYGEADRVYTLLTRGHGKLGVIAKGARRASSKVGPSLDLFAQVDVLLARGRSLDVVAQAQRLPRPRLPAEVERTAHAALIAELVERATEERTPLGPLYELTAAALDEVALEADPRRACAYFVGAFLEALGYGLQVSACAGCGAALSPRPAPFSARAGGFSCPDCQDPGAPETSVAALKVLRVVASGDLATYRRLLLEPALMAEVEEVLWAQLEHHLDRRLRSLQFIRQMRGAH
ncbi:MAG: DNA repair protein RecO [Candidatus Dormibacterales bacterium]